MKHSSVKSIRLMADMIAPLSRICQNHEFKRATKEAKTKMDIAEAFIRHCAEDLNCLLAINAGVPVDEYELSSPWAGFGALLGLLEDDDFKQLFGFQGQKKGETASGSASVSAET